ncbi:MAG: capsule biosynthesis protein [Cycloclasticus sp.]|nr:capsule biosynthesis protein [Cycloclasticus sp.]
MKDMRNTIVHEYIEDHLVDVFEAVLEYSGSLMGIMKNTKKYMAKLIG